MCTVQLDTPKADYKKLVKLFVFVGFAVAAGCSPEFPENSLKVGAQAAGNEGLQVLAPSYTFTCSGLVTGGTIRAGDTGGDDGFVFQIWRPQDDGTYTLIQSIDTTGSTERDGNELTFTTSISVLTGDTVGYRLEPATEGEDMHFFLDMSNASREVEILTRETSEIPCHLSPCDDLYTTRTGFAPFISVEFGE